jgi:hypothetical protein
MVAKKYADFEPRTKIEVDKFIAQQRERGVKLDPKHCRAVENALKEYERLHFLVEIGEGKQLPTKLLKLEGALRCLKASISAVREEEGYLWEHLLDKSDAQIGGLQDMLKATETLNKSIPRYTAPQKRARLLNRLTRKLADIYTEATGKPATTSKGVPSKRDPFLGGRGGRFPQFLRAALSCLPDERRPAEKTIRGIGSRFERINADDKAGKTISPNWIGLPYPALALPNWKRNFIRQRTGKRP